MSEASGSSADAYYGGRAGMKSSEPAFTLFMSSVICSIRSGVHKVGGKEEVFISCWTHPQEGEWFREYRLEQTCLVVGNATEQRKAHLGRAKALCEQCLTEVSKVRTWLVFKTYNFMYIIFSVQQALLFPFPYSESST